MDYHHKAANQTWSSLTRQHSAYTSSSQRQIHGNSGGWVIQCSGAKIMERPPKINTEHNMH